MSSNLVIDQAIDIPDSLKTDELCLMLMGEKLRYNVRLKTADLSAIKKSSGLRFPSKIGQSDMSKTQVMYHGHISPQYRLWTNWTARSGGVKCRLSSRLIPRSFPHWQNDAYRI